MKNKSINQDVMTMKCKTINQEEMTMKSITINQEELTMNNKTIKQEEITMMYLTRMKDLTTIEEMANYIEFMSEENNSTDIEISRVDNSDEDYGPLSEGRVGIWLGCHIYAQGTYWKFVGCNSEEELYALEEMWTKALENWYLATAPQEELQAVEEIFAIRTGLEKEQSREAEMDAKKQNKTEGNNTEEEKKNQEDIPMMYLIRMKDLTTIEEMVNYIEEFSEGCNSTDMEIFRADNSDEDYGPLRQGRIGICLGCTYFRGYDVEFVGCNTEEELDALEEMWEKAFDFWKREK